MKGALYMCCTTTTIINTTHTQSHTPKTHSQTHTSPSLPRARQQQWPPGCAVGNPVRHHRRGRDGSHHLVHLGVRRDVGLWRQRYVCLYVYLSVYLLDCLSVCLFVCLFDCLFGCLVVWLFVCLPNCLLIGLKTKPGAW